MARKISGYVKIRPPGHRPEAIKTLDAGSNPAPDLIRDPA